MQVREPIDGCSHQGRNVLSENIDWTHEPCAVYGVYFACCCSANGPASSSMVETTPVCLARLLCVLSLSSHSRCVNFTIHFIIPWCLCHLKPVLLSSFCLPVIESHRAIHFACCKNHSTPFNVMK